LTDELIKTPDGRPVFLIDDIPPVAPSSLAVAQPAAMDAPPTKPNTTESAPGAADSVTAMSTPAREPGMWVPRTAEPNPPIESALVTS
jgi:hypothetical protein